METIKPKEEPPSVQIPKTKDSQVKVLIILVVVIALVWGLVSSIDMFIVGALQNVLPARGKVKYAIYQILIYSLLLALIIYITDVDAANLFVNQYNNVKIPLPNV
jgi:hypothetical protein